MEYLPNSSDEDMQDYKIILNTKLDENIDQTHNSMTEFDQEYWKNKASSFSLNLVSIYFKMIKEIDPNVILKFNKPYIGLEKNGVASAIIKFFPKNSYLRIRVRLGDSADRFLKILMEKNFNCKKFHPKNSIAAIHVDIYDEISSDENVIIKKVFEKSFEKYAK